MGKFAPFHKGHQLLVDTALKMTDKVIVLIYDCPDITDIPLNIRAGWIKKIYPQVTVIKGYNGPSECGLDSRITKQHDEYILKTVPFKITHFFSSEWYGEHVSKALGAENIIVDIKRKLVPISGTMIRQNPYKYRKFLHPVVYESFVKKIVFLGAESTGKTTIARELGKIYKTQWMPELGREYWDKYHDSSGKLSMDQLLDLAKKHLSKEDALILKANKYFFSDTNAITTEMFSRYYHGKAHPELIKIAKKNKQRYDLWFVCDIDIPYEDDGSRSGETHRIKFQEQIINDLKRREISYTLLSGNREERIRQVQNKLEKEE